MSFFFLHAFDVCCGFVVWRSKFLIWLLQSILQILSFFFFCLDSCDFLFVDCFFIAMDDFCRCRVDCMDLKFVVVCFVCGSTEVELGFVISLLQWI